MNQQFNASTAISQLQQQRAAMQQRSFRSAISSIAGSVSSVSGRTNQVLVQLSDGSQMPAYDYSASETSIGKAVQVLAGQVQTKVGASGA